MDRDQFLVQLANALRVCPIEPFSASAGLRVVGRSNTMLSMSSSQAIRSYLTMLGCDKLHNFLLLEASKPDPFHSDHLPGVQVEHTINSANLFAPNTITSWKCVGASRPASAETRFPPSHPAPSGRSRLPLRPTRSQS